MSKGRLLAVLALLLIGGKTYRVKGAQVVE